MHLPPRGRIEWNLNTLVILGGFLVGILTWGITIGMFVSKVGDLDERFTNWVTGHEDYHKDRLADTKAVEGRYDVRVTKVEEEVRKIENLAYRVTVVEQSQASTSQAIKELKDAVNGQATDIRIMREILEQMREAQGLPPRRN